MAFKSPLQIRRLPAGIAGLAIVFLATCLLWPMMFKNESRRSFKGDRLHDFGEVSVDSGRASLSHEFVLTNASNETIRVLSAQTTCGCTSVNCPPTDVGPGSEFKLRATLEVSGPIDRQAEVHVRVDDAIEPVVVLTLCANGRRSNFLRASSSQVVLRETPVKVTLFWTPDSDDQFPGPPVVERGLDRYELSFGKWTRPGAAGSHGGSSSWITTATIARKFPLPDGNSSGRREIELRVQNSPPLVMQVIEEAEGKTDGR